VDVAFKVGENVTSVVSGKVTKLGWPYRDPSKSNLRYVEVTKNGYRFRLHYVKPSVKVGDIVKFGDVLGTAQSTGVFYKGVTEHVHVETWNKKGKRFDPTALILSLISE
jgi:murein DD-endopeptidase MepM/ murein hydrolase activator NlpD